MTVELVSAKYIRAVAFNNEQDRHLSLYYKSLEKNQGYEQQKRRREHFQLCRELTEINIRTPSLVGENFPAFLEPDSTKARKMIQYQKEMEAAEKAGRERQEKQKRKKKQKNNFLTVSDDFRSRSSACDSDSEYDDGASRYRSIHSSSSSQCFPSIPMKVSVTGAAKPSDLIPKPSEAMAKASKSLPKIGPISSELQPKPSSKYKSPERKRKELLEKLPTAMRLKIERVTQSMTMLDMLDQYRDKKAEEEERKRKEAMPSRRSKFRRHAPPKKEEAKEKKKFRVCMNPSTPRNYRDQVIRSWVAPDLKLLRGSTTDLRSSNPNIAAL